MKKTSTSLFSQWVNSLCLISAGVRSKKNFFCRVFQSVFSSGVTVNFDGFPQGSVKFGLSLGVRHIRGNQLGGGGGVQLQLQWTNTHWIIILAKFYFITSIPSCKIKVLDSISMILSKQCILNCIIFKKAHSIWFSSCTCCKVCHCIMYSINFRPDPNNVQIRS